jgi:hypothetical protein
MITFWSSKMIIFTPLKMVPSPTLENLTSGPSKIITFTP